MAVRFVYTRGSPPGSVLAPCAADFVCRAVTISEPDRAQKENYVIVVHIDSVPSTATRLVAVSEGHRDVGDPEIAFDPARGVSALETNALRSNGYVPIAARSTRTRIVYVVDGPRSFLRVVDETTGRASEVAAQPNWATGPNGEGMLGLYFHASVTRAVFLWSDSAPVVSSAL
jgi:hypothetical protein